MEKLIVYGKFRLVTILEKLHLFIKLSKLYTKKSMCDYNFSIVLDTEFLNSLFNEIPKN